MYNFVFLSNLSQFRPSFFASRFQFRLTAAKNGVFQRDRLPSSRRSNPLHQQLWVLCNDKEPIVTGAINVQLGSAELKVISTEASSDLSSGQSSEVKPKEGPTRCTTCRKRVGLTGFNCKCGNLFCAAHRYSDEHDCPYDYKNAGRDAIAKANPVVVAEKLNKI
ncbi:hypothetical protein K7X08_037347 [Anisodus acutangulus]|uniref:AN1-type domain-containing protein n=1 Tax=Anisodus acutangulus TaxID=402998 RepID=A0A9Q1RT65_9SOLA|nr:hypothetical protein K7X08_037347 [Anisodus acutangulus]